MTLWRDILLAWTFARRELRGGLAGFRIFLACLALGVAAIAGIGSVRAGIEKGLDQQGAHLLGGDAEIELTYRRASAEERDWMEDQSISVSEVIDFRSLAVVGDERALTQVQAVDDLYPLIGSLTLDPQIPMSEIFAAASTPGGAMEQILADRLELSVGDTFALGTQEFVLRAVVKAYPDNAGGGFSLGPRTFVRAVDLANSGLLGEGTLFSTKYRLVVAEGIDLGRLQARAETDLPQSGLRWTDARNGAPRIAAFVDRIGAFLILVGLSGLAVGGVGVSASVRAYLATKFSVIATLRTLGASRRVIFWTYGLQITVLTLLGIAIGLALGAAVPFALGPLIEEQLSVPLDLQFDAAPMIEAAIYGALAAAIFSLWPLAKTENIRAATLLRDAGNAGSGWPRWPYIILTAALVAGLIGLAAWFSETLYLTLWTAGGIMAALVLLALAARLVRWCARKIAQRARGRPSLRLALAAIGGPKEEASSVVLPLGLGLAVLAAVGQIDGNLRGSIERDLPQLAPSFFFVDIQKDQIDGFRDQLGTRESVSKIDSAPMMRGVITQINGRPAAEVAGDHWVLEGDRGVTYNAALPDDATVTQGAWWPEDYSGPPLVSFSAEEAEEMGLNIGDQLTVNILGRDITAEISNFREVDFSTAGIGFIMSFNPSAVEATPHTHIATVYAETNDEAAILRDVSNRYPNITAIRVKDAIERVADVLAGLAAATSYGAAATLLTGFLVLIGAAAAGEPARTFEAAVLKTVGASRKRILASFALRSIILGAAAGIVALLAGILGGWAVSTFIMESTYTVIWTNVGAIILGGIAATLLAGLGFAWRSLARTPSQVLRSRE